MPLNDARRSQLDDIVQRMATNGEPDDAIQFVVNDFKTKYEAEESATSTGNELNDIATQQGTAPIFDVIKGAAKSAVGTVYQGGDLIRRGLGMERIINTPAVQDVIKPSNTGQEIGGTVETVAEMMP